MIEAKKCPKCQTVTVPVITTRRGDDDKLVVVRTCQCGFARLTVFKRA